MRPKALTISFDIDEGYIDFRMSKRDGIFVNLVWVDADFRRQGLGTKLMDELCTLADDLGMLITLEARGDVPADVLESFYAKFGFTVIDPAPWKRLMKRPAVTPFART